MDTGDWPSKREKDRSTQRAKDLGMKERALGRLLLKASLERERFDALRGLLFGARLPGSTGSGEEGRALREELEKTQERAEALETANASLRIENDELRRLLAAQKARSAGERRSGAEAVRAAAAEGQPYVVTSEGMVYAVLASGKLSETKLTSELMRRFQLDGAQATAEMDQARASGVVLVSGGSWRLGAGDRK